MSDQNRPLTRGELHALDNGYGLLYNGRVVPLMRGGSPDDPPAGDPPAGDPPAGDPPAGDPPANDRMFTQEQVNAILARERRAQPPADYEDLKAAKQRLDELEAASKTELEKAQERATELEKQASDAKAQARAALLRAAVVADAGRKNVIDPEDVLTLLEKEGTLQFSDDGEPTNIAEAMDSLLKAKPYLVGGGRGRADLGARGEGDGKPGQLTHEQVKSMSDAEIVQAQKDGRLNDLLG